MTRTASLQAFAKLNLGLRVLAKRADGYHELRTVFQTISLADKLGVEYARSRKTEVTIDGTPHIPDNLVERACRILLDELRITARVRFTLSKVIPTGAGLGGGSSDAAAVLLSLPVLAGKRVPMAVLSNLAARLGSDVPYFLHGGTALGLGRGEELYPLSEAKASRVLVVAPAVHSSTAEAYRDLSLQLTPESLQPKLDSFQQQAWQGEVLPPVNDFESVIFARHPELGRIRKRLLGLGAKYAAMTGSGSAIFGVFNNAETILQARQALSGEHSFAVSFLSRTRYQSLWRRSLKPHLKGAEWPPLSLYAR